MATSHFVIHLSTDGRLGCSHLSATVSILDITVAPVKKYFSLETRAQALELPRPKALPLPTTLECSLPLGATVWLPVKHGDTRPSAQGSCGGKMSPRV